MKKKYIKPNVSVSFVVVESQLLAGTATGIGPTPDDNGFAGAKKHEFTDDSFDFTDWPKSKSSWETDD